MITYYSEFLILTVTWFEVSCQYLLKEYAPSHGKYESYSFAYGVSDPISGDHKHQWERMDNGAVQGEYGLIEPDGLMRLVKYTAGPEDGFKATVTKFPVKLAPLEYSPGKALYDNSGTRYAPAIISALNQEGISGNVQPELINNINEQKVNQEQINTNYVNQESRQHIIVSRATANNTQIRQNKHQNLRQKHVVKKEIEDGTPTNPGLDYITNFNLNPISIDQLNIPENEKKILHGLSLQEQQTRTPQLHLNSPKPFALHNIQLIPYIHPALIQFPSQNPQIIRNIPTSIQDVQAQQEDETNYGEKRLEQALSSIHNHPDIRTRIEKINNRYNPQVQPIVVEEQPRVLNQHTSQNNRQQIHGNNNQNLARQNNYPIILVDPVGKLGLPFYPSAENIRHPPQEEYNYEGIPEYNPSLEGKRYNNENQTAEQKMQERQYLLGERPGLFAPPPGYTRETIWQAGDPTADIEVEVLTRQLNETCAYIQWNDTTPGNEDGRPNIWQAGDYSAQLQEEELIRSANITCENYTADALANFSSGYTIIDYCYQCVKNDGSYYVIDENGNKIVPSYLPNNYGPNNEQTKSAQLQEFRQDEQQKQQVELAQYGPDVLQHQSFPQLEQPIQENYETSVERFGNQNIYDDSQGNFGRKTGPRQGTVYPNLGYRNDPQSSHYGLNRRRNTNRRSHQTANSRKNV